MPRLMWRLGRRRGCAIAIRSGHRADIVVIGTVIIVAVRLAIFGPSLEAGERAPFEQNQHRSVTPVCGARATTLTPRQDALPPCPPAGAGSLRAPGSRTLQASADRRV